MAKLVVTVGTYSPATSVNNNTQTIRISVGNIITATTGGVVEVSRQPENIITKKSDGLFASVSKSEDILSFIAAIDAALN